MSNHNGATSVVIRADTSTRARREVGRKITERVTRVHIDGHAFLWLLEDIFAQGSRVREIRLIPRAQERLTESHWALAQSHEATIVFAHAKPHCRWKQFSPRRASFAANQKFFLELPEPNRLVFQEMIAFELKAALIARRYLCLDGKRYQTLNQVGQGFGLGTGSATRVSAYVYAVRKFFDLDFPCHALSLSILGKLRAQLERARRLNVPKLERDIFCLTIAQLLKGIKSVQSVKVPANLPVSRRDSYQFAVTCLVDGRADQLTEKRPRYWKVMACRYGLDGTNVFKTWEKVGLKLKMKHQLAQWTANRAVELLTSFRE